MLHTVDVKPTKASGPGALDGWFLTCKICGPLFGYSLEGMANREAVAHTHYWIERDNEV